MQNEFHWKSAKKSEATVHLRICICALFKFTRQYVNNCDKCIDAKGISWTQFSVLCQLWDKSQLQSSTEILTAQKYVIQILRYVVRKITLNKQKR